MSRGGARAGAGRPKQSGKFGEITQPIRVPVGDVERICKLIQHRFYQLPFYQSTVSAGFPSPAEGEIDCILDLNELLIKNPIATFFLRVNGDSMIKAGIHHNDILIVDRSLEPAHGKIVIASLNGELTVKRLYKKKDQLLLMPENDRYAPISISEDSDFKIWGVVTNAIHSV